ncbi:imidazoleglycerol-phosphate dehydratase HisB [Desulfatitalea alkaliphila]|uniref:Imidazoleglycerol-phosphate dehydratase n=1 Tax=Desulfatitalea alkaliphila TaxID=2929485 RepID=A0AA41R7W8_9BACT|nr:imidazoleglycerol-phosphate dehydratase HisB [Desulfatitalea alkaliphila]MCJ8500603.1 imidazoleglycerol-phosphate dehydratase HisB [Desulfatitalea alkaliphila]
MKRVAELERKTKETQIRACLCIDGDGRCEVTTGIGFFDHMLTLMCVHGRLDLTVTAEGDIQVDYHHTVEDVGLVLGQALSQALGERKGICRYGYAVIPMDDALAKVAVDLSNRPYLYVRAPSPMPRQNDFDLSLAKEFLRALAYKAGMNLHVEIAYGDNWHHMIEAVFKGLGRALRQAAGLDEGVVGVPSSKGAL